MMQVRVIFGQDCLWGYLLHYGLLIFYIIGEVIFDRYTYLKTTGVSSKSTVTRGVPRLKELLSVSKNIKAPSMTVYLDNTIGLNKDTAKNVLNNIALTRFF